MLCGKNIEVCPRLEFDGFFRNSLMSLLNVAVCDIRVIPFVTIMASEIFYPPTITNLPPLFELIDEASEGFCGIIGTHHLDQIFF